MQKTDIEKIIAYTGYKKSDFSVCLSCKICASVCTLNDFSMNTNPQGLLLKIFLGDDSIGDDPLIKNCVSCYRCTDACPWQIRVPEVVRAIRETLGLSSPFEKAFKGSISIWGRVYEPYIFLNAIGFLIKNGYLKHLTKWTEYISFHLPHKIKRI